MSEIFPQNSAMRPDYTVRQRELALKTAREVAGRLIETNALSPAGLPEAISLLAETGRIILGHEMPKGAPTLKLAKEICLKLIERHRLNSPKTAAATLVSLGILIARAARETPPEALWLLSEAKELTIKMIEGNRLTGDNLNEFFLSALTALKAELD